MSRPPAAPRGLAGKTVGPVGLWVFAVGDLIPITTAIDDLAVDRRYLHVDAALAGIPLALLDRHERPAIGFRDGADSITISGHKFLGTPVPCGVLVTRHVPLPAPRLSYVDCPDTTIGGSRNGHVALMLWYALHTHGRDGLHRRAQAARQVAGYTVDALNAVGWPAWRHRHAFTVVIDAIPPLRAVNRWILPEVDGQSHVICMPGITTHHIDRLVEDFAAARPPAATTRPPGRRPPAATAAPVDSTTM